MGAPSVFASDTLSSFVYNYRYPPSQLAMGSGGSAKKSEEKHTILPVTIRSIEVAVSRRSGDDEVVFYGSEPSMIVLTGVVESVSQQAASLEIAINDSTGRIRIRQYSPEPGSVLATVAPGQYIQVAGNLRTSPEVHVTVASARVVQSPDEISYHMIEAVHAALRLQRGDAEAELQPPKMDIDMVGAQPKLQPTGFTQGVPAGVPPVAGQANKTGCAKRGGRLFAKGG